MSPGPPPVPTANITAPQALAIRLLAGDFFPSPSTDAAEDAPELAVDAVTLGYSLARAELGTTELRVLRNRGPVDTFERGQWIHNFFLAVVFDWSAVDVHTSDELRNWFGTHFDPLPFPMAALWPCFQTGVIYAAWDHETAVAEYMELQEKKERRRALPPPGRRTAAAKREQPRLPPTPG
jgi:hypothetical protein